MTNSLQQLLPETHYKSGKKNWWGGLYGSSQSLIYALLSQSSEHFIVIISKDIPSAQNLYHELEFFNTNQDINIYHFPDWETLPYDHFSPHQDIISERIATLYHIPRQRRGILIIPFFSLMQKLPPLQFIEKNTLIIDQGMTINLSEFRQELQQKGYRHVNTVMEHGEFSVRGSLVDIFPMGSKVPYRLDLFDDELESIKCFDPDTQRTSETIEQIHMMPAREFPTDADSIEFFRENYRQQIGGELTESLIYSEVSSGKLPAGIEYYMPLFFEKTGSLFDYLPENSLLCHFHELHPQCENYLSEINQRYEQYRHNIQRPVLDPGDLFLNTEQLFTHFKQFPLIISRNFAYEEKSGVHNFATQSPDLIHTAINKPDGFKHLQQLIEQYPGKTLLVAESAGRLENLNESLLKHDIRAKRFSHFEEFISAKEKLGITIGYLESGLSYPAIQLQIIPESQLYGNQIMQRRRREKARQSKNEDAIINSLAELEPGTPVVHEHNGIGRYQGLEVLDIDDQPTEFLLLTYKDDDKLYVPVSSLHLISRYTGASPETAPLHKLGSGQWEKAKRKAKEKIHDVAAELLEIYARREAQQGLKYQLDESDYEQFCQAFPFEETADQAAAIEQVIQDMTGPKPMDRLICGDVGFGKTEVAIRAAFVAIQNDKQVAILVPTTLLSQQHTENIQNRFAELPVKIRGLSRFQTPKQQKEILQGVADGTIDIVIGTHKLLQKHIKFKRLGLLIIDEEHRFGVRQKERFKQLKNKVDVLTMTATPIPRTLNMSLSGIRDFSIIATAPAKRLAIKTFVSEWNDTVIREACQRELMRGGQVFFLHNKVSSIDKCAMELAQLLPDAKIEVAHGQMPEHELESVMADFYHQRFNILVCTTIIETGIDIPTANTIIIDRADNFGLAQLYQLRGRVGRSHHRAYAYLTIPSKKVMTADAVKRLEAIESIEELGAGFTLASHDLEIRGAGELLGEGQSGQMQEIGFTLYTELLDRAVKSLKSGKTLSLDDDEKAVTEIDLSLAALIPNDYMPDVHLRLIMYKRISSAKNEDELRELQIEMIDRFGLLPDPCKNLFQISSIKLIADKLGIEEVHLSEYGGRILFNEKPDIDPVKIIDLIQKKPSEFRLEGNNKLRLLKEIEEAEQRIDYIRNLCEVEFC